MIFLMSASSVARIIGVSHWSLAKLFVSEISYLRICVKQIIRLITDKRHTLEGWGGVA
jgi:hypothetical protein